MTKLCEKCSKKITAWSNEPLELCDGKLLCYNCASPVRKKLYDLSNTKTQTGFDRTKTEILEICRDQYNDIITQDIEKIIQEIYNETEIESVNEEIAKKTFLKQYMLTTSFDFNGYKITKYLGIISGQVVLGTGFLSELSASFADFFGEESNKFAQKLETAKNAAIEKLILKSAEKGGNAIIGVNFDYIKFNGNMIGVVANGTSVFIEKQ